MLWEQSNHSPTSVGAPLRDLRPKLEQIKSPVILPEELNAKIFQVSALTDDNCPTVRLDPNVESDSYTISWFLSEGDHTAPIVEDQLLPVGTYSASFNPKNYAE